MKQCIKCGVMIDDPNECWNCADTETRQCLDTLSAWINEVNKLPNLYTRKLIFKGAIAECDVELHELQTKIDGGE